ncbi:MAG: sulfotransferase [Candidatus Krumholzibacteriia bacterium]
MSAGEPRIHPARRLNRRVRAALGQASEFVRSLGATVHTGPLLILGNQKSGTTAIAALLSEMTGIRATLDLKKEMSDPVIDHVKSGAMSFDAFVRRNKLDFSRPIIKEPSLTLFYDELSRYFPRSRFVMVIRDPRDNIRSILDRVGIPGNLEGLDERELEGMSRAWRLILDNRWLGIEGGHYIDALAHRWNHAIDLYRRHSERTVLSRYETFLDDKMGEITRLAEVLGMPARHDVSGRVDVQFQPAGNRGVRWVDFYGSDNLARIESICAERMAGFDYDPSR